MRNQNYLILIMYVDSVAQSPRHRQKVMSEAK